MRQTCALLLDAYRELNAKKLFWITLVLSGLVVLLIAAIGISSKGYSVFGWSPEFLEDPRLSYLSDSELDEMRSDFYQQAFNLVGITIWLTWAAIILAIFSTASIFPDLMTTGAIDTLLTKPISRLRLFLTKYCLGLGFVAMQVAVFSIFAFVVVGVRAGDWEPKLFLAIPIVLLFFSYLYAICVLVGVYTRSTLLAVILTGLAWVGMFAINFADDILLGQQAEGLVRAEVAEQRLAYMKTLPAEADLEDGAPAGVPAGDSDALESGDATQPAPAFAMGFEDVNTREGYARVWGSEDSLRMQAEDGKKMAEVFGKWRGYAYLAKTPLPKTGETRSLMTRVLIDQEDLDAIQFDPADDSMDFYDPFGGTRTALLQKKSMELIQEQRGWAWILITSILFEVFVVGLAAWKFCRRDY